LIRILDGKIRIRDPRWKNVGSGIKKRKFDREIKTEGKKANRES
jgi:hypothetical protein